MTHWNSNGHVTSSVTWPCEFQWVISYWWSIGPKSLSLTVSEIFRPKHHVLIDTMLNRHCACAISRDMYPYVKFKYIFQFLAATLPIHYDTFIGLRWRIRGVLSVTSLCSTLVRNTVVRATFKVNGKPSILGSRSPLTPWPIDLTFHTGDYVGDMKPQAKNGKKNRPREAGPAKGWNVKVNLGYFFIKYKKTYLFTTPCKSDEVTHPIQHKSFFLG